MSVYVATERSDCDSTLRFGSHVKTLCFIVLLAFSSWVPIAWGAAQPGKQYRVGYLSFSPLAEIPSIPRTAFLRAMEKLGYVQGRNMTIEYRSAEGNVDLLSDAIADL